MAAATWVLAGGGSGGGAGASALSGGVAPGGDRASRPRLRVQSDRRAGMARGVKTAGVPGMDVAGAAATAAAATDWMSLLRHARSAVSSLLGGGPGVAVLLRRHAAGIPATTT